MGKLNSTFCYHVEKSTGTLKICDGKLKIHRAFHDVNLIVIL
jgi:hypothetical protein